MLLVNIEYDVVILEKGLPYLEPVSCQDIKLATLHLLVTFFQESVQGDIDRELLRYLKRENVQRKVKRSHILTNESPIHLTRYVFGF